MACELEQEAYKKAATSANYQNLKRCQQTAYQRGEATAAREAQAAAAKQQADTAAMYASGGPLKDLKVGADYKSDFDPSKYMQFVKPSTVKGPNIGLVLGAVFGGGVFLLIILYFLVKGGKSSRPYGGYPYPPPPGYKKKKAKRKKRKK